MSKFIQKQVRRLKNCGSLAGVVRKIKYKIDEKNAMKQFGTASFPSEEERIMQSKTVFKKNTKFSILVPLYNTPENYLVDMIESVRNQTYQNWELCLADGSDREHEYVVKKCLEYSNLDTRIVYQKLESNEGISGNTNQCYKLATGDYIGLFDHDDILHPCVLFEYAKVIDEQEADFVYCDELTFQKDNINSVVNSHFKPDFAVDNLRANNYICHFSVFSRELLEGGALFLSEYDGSQDHDMILRLTDRAKKIVHVPKILYYWRSHPGSVASGIEAKTYAIDAAKRAVSAHLDRHGFKNYSIESSRAFPTIFNVKYEIIGNPKISIIIPNKDHIDDLKRCVESILYKSTYNNYEIIIVENNSETDEIFSYYDSLLSNDKIRVIKYSGKFNYSAINNTGVNNAIGDYILLLNNDTEVITPTWIEDMLMFAQRDDVGAVGAKLLYPDGSIQHAGVVLQLGAHRTAGHIFAAFPNMAVGYMGKLCYPQEMSAVTGACLMVNREKYKKVGGLDESFEVCLNDVDLCIKLQENGYHNIFSPYAELVHYESQSRGLDESEEKKKRYNDESNRFKEKWKTVLENGDPYFNPNISLDHTDYTVKVKGK